MNWKAERNKKLVEAFLTLKTAEEMQRFLCDLMTESEITEFAKRFEAARLLSTDTPYSKVQKTTGLSSTTIARVSKWLRGSLGGYQLVISRLATPHHTSTPTRGSGLR